MLFNVEKYGIGVAIVFALAGLGLFLVAVKLMSSSMKTMSSGYTSHLLKRMHNNIWVGLIFGIVFTTMIQSSDGTVALCIGLIGAGLLTLKGAIPIILGANIGTATTALIVALGSAAGKAFVFIQYLPLLVFFGAAALLFVKEERKTNVAMLVFAIGAIFLGLKVLSSGMDAITSQAWFHSFTKGVSHDPWVALLANIEFTGIVQSSSATVTVVQHIYTFNDLGQSSMSINSAIAMVIGANIGTTFTAIITSIGAPKDAKRIAIVWLLTNVAMAMIIMPIINYYGQFITMISPTSSMVDVQAFTSDFPGVHIAADGYSSAQVHWLEYIKAHPTRPDGSAWNAFPTIDRYEDLFDQLKSAKSTQSFQLAWAHLMFNTFLVSVFIWFVNPLVKLTTFIIKDEKVHQKYEVHLPIKLIKENPDLALEAAQNSTNALGRMSEDYILMCQEFIVTPDKKNQESMQNLKSLIEKTRQAVYAYLVEIGRYDISKRNSNRQMLLVLVARSLEKIPLVFSSIMKELNDTMKRGKLDISESTQAELQTIFAVLLNMTTKAAKQLGRFSQTRSKEIQDMNEYVDYITQRYAQNFLARKESMHDFDYISTLKEIGRIAHHANRVNTYMSRGSIANLKVKDLSANLEKEILKGLS